MACPKSGAKSHTDVGEMPQGSSRLLKINVLGTERQTSRPGAGQGPGQGGNVCPTIKAFRLPPVITRSQNSCN